MRRIAALVVSAYTPTLSAMSPTFRIVCGVLIFIVLVIAMQYIPTQTEDQK